MKIINKSDMRFVEGYLVDKDGNVLNEPTLVDNVNTIFEMADFNKFVNANKTRIQAPASPRPPRSTRRRPRLSRPGAKLSPSTRWTRPTRCSKTSGA